MSIVCLACGGTLNTGTDLIGHVVRTHAPKIPTLHLSPAVASQPAAPLADARAPQGHTLALEQVLPTSVLCKDPAGPRQYPNCNAALDVRKDEVSDLAICPSLCRKGLSSWRCSASAGQSHDVAPYVC